MGIIGLEKANHLFWLGRYTERVFTTLRTFFKYYDGTLENKVPHYPEYCKRLAINNIYMSAVDFKERYLFDEENMDSIYTTLLRAYDNAIVMRNDISTESLAYIELAIDSFRKARESEAPIVSLQPVIDYIFAFWASIDDFMLNEESRNIIKCGKYIERMDLLLRLKDESYNPKADFIRLESRIKKVDLCYNKEYLTELGMLYTKNNYLLKDPAQAIFLIENIFNV